MKECPAKRGDRSPAAGGPSADDVTLSPRHLVTPSSQWRSLEEWNNSPELEELQREFPDGASDWAATDPVSRRRFLALMGASLGLAGVNGCGASPPREKIVPYVRTPEQLVPGRPLFYATAFPLAGYATGVLVESHMGRPTKIEGNPDHPASLGATDVFAQASILGLYDPDRSQTITNRGQISSYGNFVKVLQEAMSEQRKKKGAGLRILTETIGSPTLAYQLRALFGDPELSEAKWCLHEPVSRQNIIEGCKLAFGTPCEPVYRFDKAEVVLSLDADFLSSGPGHLRYAHDFMGRRRVWDTPGGQARMNRLYVVESTPSTTGAVADHRLPMRASAIVALARTLGKGMEDRLRERPPEKPDYSPLFRFLGAALGSPAVDIGEPQKRWLQGLIGDLVMPQNAKSAMLAGSCQPPGIHGLVHALNAVLGNIGETVDYVDPVAANPVEANRTQSLKELTEDLAGGDVELLVILSGNPVYTAPADVELAAALNETSRRANALTIHLGLYQDETARLCQWHIPETHYLEMWSDGRAYDGTASIIQPLIAPLYQGAKSVHEVVAALSGHPELSGHGLVRDYWRRFLFPEERDTKVAPDAFERVWQQSLHDGFIARTTSTPKQVQLQEGWSKGLAELASKEAGGLEIVFKPDPAVFDGRFANNAWLQELPKPLTKLTWDNAALMSKKTAEERFGVRLEPGWKGGEHGQVFADLIELQYRGRTLRLPAWIVPGHAEDSVTVHLGYGRTFAGKVGTGAGFNAYTLRTSQALWFDGGLEVTKAGGKHLLACTQFHHLMMGRDLARSLSLDNYRKGGTGRVHLPMVAGAESAKPRLGAEDRGFEDSAPATHQHHGHASLFPEWEYKGYKWGMAIDLTACTGCGACVVACQAENNIPVVGKEQVARGREMHWLRIDTYHEGDPANPATHFQPVPCMQCENAPCELVCPVAATSHSPEGLNDMTYNRCVGTRYCSNNCPYKVRRFNFFQFADYATESLKLQRNPDVTVRSRGVMEKCTYCVQRINAGRIEAEKEDRRIADGDVLTACQAACPTRAIVFGDLNDQEKDGKARSEVGKMKESRLNYALLEELNTRPRTTYLERVRNPSERL